MAFLLRRVQKRREHPTRALLAEGWGVLSYTTGGKGVTQLSWSCRATGPPPARSPPWGPHLRPISGRPPRLSPYLPAPWHLAGGAPQKSPAGRAPGPSGSQGPFPPGHPRPERTRTAVEGVDPGETRQAPVAERLHARGSARRRRRLRQIGNPTLIAQQRREGAGGGRAGRRGAGRGGQPRRPKLPGAGRRRGEAGKQVAGRSEPELPGEEGRAGEGRRAPPGALPATAARTSPAADPGAAAPQPARRLATSPGLRGGQGRGGGGRDQSARGSRAPSPAAARLQTRSGGVGSSPSLPGRPGERGSSL